jgi:hypothetical protein
MRVTKGTQPMAARKTKRRKNKPYSWAWRWLPFETRFCLVMAHRLPKRHADRDEMARFLLDVRRKAHAGQLSEYP